jgi:hypothetical protein
MRSLARKTALVSLLVAGVSYFLPWFTWSSGARVEYSDRFKSGLSGLPPELLPRDWYEIRVTVSPAGEAFGWYGIDTPKPEASEDIDPIAIFTQLLPAIHFGPRSTSTSRVGFAIFGLLLVPAFACVLLSRRWLAAAFVVGALLAGVVALLALPQLSKCLRSAEEARDVELPEVFRVRLEMRYGTTPWFWAGAVSSLAGATATAWWALTRREPVGPPSGTEPCTAPDSASGYESWTKLGVWLRHRISEPRRYETRFPRQKPSFGSGDQAITG